MLYAMCLKNFDIYETTRNDKKGKRKYQEGGGIVCIAKVGLTKPGKKSKCDDLLWVRTGDLHLAGAYFVPPSSTFVKKNDRRMQELQEQTLRLAQKGRVMIVTDANAWIGEKPSIIEADEESFVFTRKSEKTQTNAQGNWFIEKMNAINMLILKGSKARPSVRAQCRRFRLC